VEAQGPGWRASFLGTLRASFRWGGRATGSELAVYWLTVAFFNLAIGIPASFLLDYSLTARIDDVLALIYTIPLPGLFVRRLHDHGRSGQLLWLAAPGVGLWLAQKAVFLSSGLEARVKFDALSWPLDWLATLTTMAFLILLILPGTIGPNRFGPDPRGRES
jgi:uncharacterized membrane protein YhaH (DUF805 family)